MKRTLLLCCLVAVAVIGLQTAGCQSGEGERCQVDDDCVQPLRCNKTKNTCETSSGFEEDADLPIDAPVDAPPDMPPMIDARDM